MSRNSSVFGATKSKLMFVMSRFRAVPEDVAQVWESLHRKRRAFDLHVHIYDCSIRANVAQIPDASASFRENFAPKFSFISANRPDRILTTRDERSRLTRIQYITVLDHEISLTLMVLLARNPDCEIDYKRIRMLGANYTTLLIYGPISGGANRVQFGSNV